MTGISLPKGHCFEPRHLPAMEPGRDDRDQAQAVVCQRCTERPPQWSPVEMTGIRPSTSAAKARRFTPQWSPVEMTGIR